MPRKNTNVKPSRRVEETCPECAGKGQVTEEVTYMKPTGTAYEYSGEVASTETRTRSCNRCAGRGKIIFWTTEEVIKP